jgi:hypothetical protein
VIKSMYLSFHNPGSLEISKNFKQLSTYKPGKSLLNPLNYQLVSNLHPNYKTVCFTP